MKTKHTPGPWHRNIRAGGKYPVVFAGRNTHVAMATQMPNPEVTEANIDLIAAAPDMLAALCACADLIGDSYERLDYATAPAALREARAAIAKATGTEKETT